MKQHGTRVLALHVGFVDTDLTRELNVPKSDPDNVVPQTLEGVVAGKDEVLADEATRVLKQRLSRGRASYIDPPTPG